MRIDLSERLGEGQFVEIRDPNKLTWGQQKSIASALSDDSLSGQLETAERIAIALIKGGYVLDADDKPVTFPLTEQNVGDVPGAVIEEVASAFAEAKKANTPKN